MNMLLNIETITPKMAESYLKRNTSNRVLRKSLVSQYARDMINGEWKLTHQGVAFDNDGVLLDGQHRLQAIVESGIAVQMMVARNVEHQSQLVMDDHAKRSANDALTLIRGEKVSSMDVAVIRAAVESQEYRRTHNTKTEINELLDIFHDPLLFIKEFYATSQRGITSAPVWGAIALAWFYVDDLERLHNFCRILRGFDMAFEEGDKSPQILREWLLRTGARHSGQRVDAFKKTQRAIVAFMKHQKIDKLYGTVFYYPWPLVAPLR